MSKKVSAAIAPHSWAVTDWPTQVYPHNASKGRYIVRAHRDDLLKAGALVRIGRDLVVLGAAYSRWLESQADRVNGFTIAPNAMQVQAAA